MTRGIALVVALGACGKAHDHAARDARTAAAPGAMIDATIAPSPAPHGPTLAHAPAPLPVAATIVPRPAAGPFADVAAYCAQQPDTNRRGDPMPCNHGAAHVDGPAAVDAPPAPFTDVHLFPVDGGVSCSLAMTTANGVFVADRAMGCDWPGRTGLTVKRLAAVGGVIALSWQRRSTFSIGGVTTAELEELAIVCGVGPSGTPSCTPAIPLRLARTPKGGATRDASISLVVGSDGSITLDGDPHALVLDRGDELRAEAIGGDLGHRRLIFP